MILYRYPLPALPVPDKPEEVSVDVKPHETTAVLRDHWTLRTHAETPQAKDDKSKDYDEAVNPYGACVTILCPPTKLPVRVKFVSPNKGIIV